MTSRERLETCFSGGQPDRTPLLGGWIACPDHIATLAGVSIQQYREHPVETSIAAYQRLGVDGLASLFVPKDLDGYRCVDSQSYMPSVKMSLEDALARIDEMPGADDIIRTFDLEAEYLLFKEELEFRQRLCGGMVYMPAQWSAGAKASFYDDFGYETFFTIVGLHPARARKLMEVGGAEGLCRSRLVARAVSDGIYPGAVLLGQDICTQRGPMISTEFLERYYAPQLARGLSPLLEAGCKPVWHCDGDVRPLLDMLIDAGIQGFQGFQSECGMTLESIVRRKTREGEPLVIFGPLSVTKELPFLSPSQIKRKVRQAIRTCRGRARLALFTSNTINPDVPLANILAMSEAIQSSARML